jgi:hypothetical protein
MLRVSSLCETFSAWDPDKGADPATNAHTEGTLHLKVGDTFPDLAALNERMGRVGISPITSDTLKAETWQHNPCEDDPGRYDISFIGDNSGLPDKAGRFIYDCSLYLSVIEETPATPERLMP